MSTVGPDKRLNYYRLSPDKVIKELRSHKMGLTNVEAERRLRAHGPNMVKTTADGALLSQLARACREPIILLLFVGIILSVFTDDLAARGVLLLIAVASIAATAALNHRRVASATSLGGLVPSSAKVIRNGDIHTIETATVVIGDIVSLNEGDIVPADLRLLEETNLTTDDAALTGSHSLSYKAVHAAAADTPLFERHGMVYMGSRVATGKARGVVTAVGTQTELGRIAALTESTQQHTPPFQVQLQRITAAVAWIVIIAAICTGALGFAVGMTAMAALHASLLVIVAATPLGLLVELFLIRLESRTQLAGLHLRIQALSALDAIAATDIVILDHTAAHAGSTTSATHVLVGRTIYTTEGRGYDPVGKIMGTSEVEISGKELDNLALVFTAAALTSSAKVYQAHNHHAAWHVLGDQIGGAMITLARRAGINTEALHGEYQRERRLSANRAHTLTAGIYNRNDEHILFARGTVAAISERSKKLWDHNHIRNFTKGDALFLQGHVESESLDAHHTAALAYRILPKNTDPASTDIEELANGLIFLGVISTHTPLHEVLPDAVRTIKRAGIAVSMLTNEDPGTARAIARHAGVVATNTSGIAITSSDLRQLEDAQILQYLENGGAAFSYLSPEDTLRLVEIAETAGHPVLLTGYGAADLPALAHASAGISITKSIGQHLASAPHGSALASAIVQGRLAYLHMQQAMRAVLTDHAAAASLVLLGFVGQAAYNQPAPIAVFSLLAFGILVQLFPVIELAWDTSSEHTIQQHPKRSMPVSLNTAGQITMFGVLAGTIAYINFLLYFARVHVSPAYIDQSSVLVGQAASIAFVTLVTCQLLNILFLRAERHATLFSSYLWNNSRLLLALGVALFVMLNMVYNPPLARVFGFVGLDGGDWVMVFMAAISYTSLRLLQRHTRKHSRHAVVKLHHKIYGKNSAARI